MERERNGVELDQVIIFDIPEEEGIELINEALNDFIEQSIEDNRIIEGQESLEKFKEISSK